MVDPSIAKELICDQENSAYGQQSDEGAAHI
jgi:hypothetical protein